MTFKLQTIPTGRKAETFTACLAPLFEGHLKGVCVAKLGDKPEVYTEESLPFFFEEEKILDFSALQKYDCLTLAQLVIFLSFTVSEETGSDWEEIYPHYMNLVFSDMVEKRLDPKDPKTLIPNSEYLRMAKQGYFGDGGCEKPMPTADWLISVEDVSKWGLTKGFQLKFEEFKDAFASRGEIAAIASVISSNTATANWQERARGIADECFDRDTSSGSRDSLVGYSRRVMAEMQSRGIKGPRGVIDNPSTVMREALQGEKWWKNKQK